MLVNLLYFGLIAEAINCNKECITTNENSSVSDLKNTLLNKYKVLKKIDFQIAVNQQIVSKETLIKPNSEIALLPPFAGG